MIGVLHMRILFLSGSRLSDGQKNAVDMLRMAFDSHGDSWEVLDWRSLFVDTVPKLNARSRKAVRRHLRELLNGGNLSELRTDHEHPEIGNLQRLVTMCAEELGQFVRSGEFDLVFCFEPLAALLVGKAAESARFSARTVMIGADGHLHGQLNMQNTDGEIFLGDPTTAAEREAIYETICGMRQEAGASTGKSAAPTIQSSLRHHILKMPEAVYEASGIIVNGRRLKSFVFSTDLAIIRNCDADAVFAVYPFTPQQAISEAVIKAAYVPVFCGVGGGTTKGVRTVGLAKDAEAQGAMGLVLNAPISSSNLRDVADAVDIPVVITVVSEGTNIARRLEYGASILNVAGAADTPAIVQKIRAQYPDIPIIASGGNSNENIRATIRAGANAVTYTPPSTKELFRATMSKYRES